MEYFVENEIVNGQINKVKKLFLLGHSDKEIAKQFESEHEVNLISRSVSWSSKDIENIRLNFEINNPYQKSEFISIASQENIAINAHSNAAKEINDSHERPLIKPINQKKGFFIKLANGDFGLSKTFWLLGALPGVIVIAIISGIIFIYDVYKRFEYDNKLFFFGIALFLAYTVYSLFILIGVRRAAKKQGSMLGVFGRVIVFCSVIGFSSFAYISIIIVYGAFSNDLFLKISSSSNLRWFAEGGDPDAQYRLGDSYYIIDSRKPNLDSLNGQEAVKWYRLAAEQGYLWAQVRLGDIYYMGAIRGDGTHRDQDVLPDHQEAAKWYLLAAGRGNAKAQHALTLMYSLGEGVSKNGREAVKWLRLAADNGHIQSQVMLGQWLDDGGPSIVQNSVEAYAWLKLATILDAEQGGLNNDFLHDENGKTIKEQADTIYAELTAIQAAEAQSLLNQLYNRIGH